MALLESAWVRGFRARCEGKPRPAAGDKAKGWDAADRMITAFGGKS